MMEYFTVEYQRIWVDYLVADGSYTPTKLRQAGLVMKHEPEVLSYQMAWPGGVPQPPRTELRLEGTPGHWRIVRSAI